MNLSLERSELPAGAQACVRFWSGKGDGAPQEACSVQPGETQANSARGTGHANRNAGVG